MLIKVLIKELMRGLIVAGGGNPPFRKAKGDKNVAVERRHIMWTPKVGITFDVL